MSRVFQYVGSLEDKIPIENFEIIYQKSEINGEEININLEDFLQNIRLKSLNNEEMLMLALAN